MGDGVHKYVHILHAGAGAAGEIDNKRFTPDNGGGAGNHCVPGDFERLGAHSLGNAGDVFIRDCNRCLGRNIPRRAARAAGRKYEVKLPLVAEPNKLLLQNQLIVGDNYFLHDLVACLAQALCYRGTALVLALPRRRLVAERDDRSLPREMPLALFECSSHLRR